MTANRADGGDRLVDRRVPELILLRRRARRLAQALEEVGSMARLVVRLLGRFDVRLDDAPITTFAYDKVRALLAYLVTEAGHPVRRERLTGLLWPDYPERSARQNLSQALFTLRNALGDTAGRGDDSHYLLASRQTIEFACTDGVWSDVNGFDAAVKATRTHTHADLRACESCLAQLAEAVALYRGDFLEDLSLDDSAAFEEWALLQRERLRQLELEALDVLSDSALQHGDIEAALRYARRQLALDPWREPAHRQVMRALALNGQRTAALAQYEACRALLKDELQVAPEIATTALYTAIRDAEGIDTAVLLPPSGLLPAPGESPFKGLHFFDVEDADLFFGREALTTRLVERLTGGERFLAIVGLGQRQILARKGWPGNVAHPRRCWRRARLDGTRHHAHRQPSRRAMPRSAGHSGGRDYSPGSDEGLAYRPADAAAMRAATDDTGSHDRRATEPRAPPRERPYRHTAADRGRPVRGGLPPLSRPLPPPGLHRCAASSCIEPGHNAHSDCPTRRPLPSLRPTRVTPPGPRIAPSLHRRDDARGAPARTSNCLPSAAVGPSSPG